MTDSSKGKTARWWVPQVVRGYQRSWLGTDILAGITLAAISIPECMGYTKIAGTPVVTGLYTMLLPVVAFALLGSSRHLVVGADSATAAILFSGLVGVAQPYSDRWLALASTSALVTAVFLLLAAILRLGFLTDFLSRTVLVGFLSGVGVSLMIGQLPDMLNIPIHASGFIPRLAAFCQGLSHTDAPALGMSAAVLIIIFLAEKLSPKAPGALIAVVLSIVVTWVFHLEEHGITVVGAVHAGLPRMGLPQASLRDALGLLPICASMFLVILAQSAATARSFAQKYAEPLDENRDLIALCAANALAGVSNTFVVNGSPTKTAIVDAAGGRTQVAHLTTAGMVLAMLLFATALIRPLPIAALASIVFVIGARLVNLRALREIYQFRRRTFAVALLTLLFVVFFGIQRGILMAVAMSILDHLEQEYHPRDVIIMLQEGQLKPARARKGLETEPGLLIYRFQAPLFFANVDYFVEQIHKMVAAAAHPVQWLVLDFVSMSDIDYTAGLTLHVTVKQFQDMGITVGCVNADDVRDQLDRFGITSRIDSKHFFDWLQPALDAFHAHQDAASEKP